MKLDDQAIKQEGQKTIKTAYGIFAITFLIFCTAAFIVYKGQGELLNYTDTANKYTNLPVRVEEVLSLLKDSETGVRGFLYTKDSIFLQPYNFAAAKVDSVLEIIEDYAKIDVIDKDDFNNLKIFSIRILSIQKSYLKNNKPDHTLDLRYGRTQMDSLREITSTIKTSIMNRSATYRQGQNDSIAKQPFYLVLIIFIALSIFLLAAFFILKFIKNLIISQQNLAQKIVEVEKYNRELDQYSFTLTHHLQEPLRKIRLFLSRFESKNKSLLTEGGDESLIKIDDTAQLAQAYLNEFLNYSKLMQKKDNIVQPINLNRIIKEVLDENNDRIKNLEATVTVDIMPIINGNENFIKLLWQHLIDNALKYTRAGKKPIIHIVSLNNSNGGDFHFAVTDNGCGMNMEHAEKVFELFQRLENNTKVQGLGMGLAICKRIVEEYNGRITVESVVNKGSTFHIFLPKTDNII